MSDVHLPGHSGKLARPTPALAILGAGFVGKAILRRHPDTPHTHRPGTHTTASEEELRIHRFSLDATETWGNLSTVGRMVVWTFPARPLSLVKEYYEKHLSHALGLIVLGSTSAYRMSEDVGGKPGVWLAESGPLDLTQERVKGEEWLRNQGATVLRLAGIHGPGRLPLDWARKGLIKNGAKWLNLAHVDDIVDIIEHTAIYPQPGETFNVADGRPIIWNDLIDVYRQRGDLPADFRLPQGQAEGKRISNERLRRLLPNHQFRFP